MGMQQMLLGIGGATFVPTDTFYGYGYSVTGVFGTETVPAGATNVVIEIWGAGGGGGGGSIVRGGGGGGGGSYCRSSYACSGGQTMAYTGSQSGVPGNTDTTGGAGSTTVVSSGTLTITTLTANGGSGGISATLGGVGGAGAVASTGGNQVNGVGGPGGISSVSAGGGQGPAAIGLFGAGAPGPGSSGGTGGAPSTFATNSSIRSCLNFHYT